MRSCLNQLRKYSLGVLLMLPLPATAIESLGYEVLAQHDNVEIRAYQPHLLATVDIDADFEGAGNSAFRDLFRYIDGNNASQQKIAMTAPVIQAPSDNGWKVSFVMPADFELDTLPPPAAAQINVHAEPAMVMAALSYSGNWSRKRYLENEQTLKQRVAELGLSACDQPKFARHNPPFWPSFLRKNEILIPLCE